MEQNVQRYFTIGNNFIFENGNKLGHDPLETYLVFKVKNNANEFRRNGS